MVDPRRLVVLLDEAEAGLLEMTRTGRLRFSYAPDRPPDAIPLSLSMPMTARHHEGRVVSAFAENVLPDNDGVLDRWRQELGFATSRWAPLGGISARQGGQFSFPGAQSKIAMFC